MPPQLVVATSAATSYPGGVIALRCSDWMGPARGTLSDTSDAFAVCGEAVIEEQQTSFSLWSAWQAAFQDADDTLVVPLASLNVESAPTDGMRYRVFASVKIEGDWDVTNSDTFRGSNFDQFVFGCEIGFYGDDSHATDASPSFSIAKARGRPHYFIVQLGTTADIVGDETLHFRAYSAAGTTIVFRLDQIYLVPQVIFGTKLDEWTGSDFRVVGGAHNTSGEIYIEPGGGFIDGADGGDVNGKFTWDPWSWENTTDFSGADGGGDYQQKASAASAEYMARVIPDDSYYLVNSKPAPDIEAPAHAYSVHGANYRPATVWVDDDFSRTVASGWGTGPQGIGWWGGVSVNGTHGLSGAGSTDVHLRAGVNPGGPAAEFRARDFIWSGVFEIPTLPTVTGANPLAIVDFILQDLSGSDAWELIVDLLTSEWRLQLVTSGSPGRIVFHGPVDISSYLASGADIGYKIELKRQLLRVKIWDASGAEPGTWDYEDFIPVGDRVTPNEGLLAYPYGDDLSFPIDIGELHPIISAANHNMTAFEIHQDWIKLETDPYGDPGSVFAAMYHPDEGTLIGEIEIPYGAWQFVYWGTRDWTSEESGFPAYLDFSAKVWNEVGSAELQRAETLFWYFRSLHGGGIVSMNWRSAESPHVSHVFGGSG